MMKRSMEDREVEALAMANCLMLLARVGKNSGIPSDRVFECKTCKKSFSSFQALGGHRASHKRPRLMENAGGDILGMTEKVSVSKPKIHECSICGQSFPMGQALGGHMRRHRAEPQGRILLMTNDHKPTQKAIPVLMRCNSKRIILDLNLTPYENELEFEKIAPALGCF